ncbi:synaptotagmin-like protein 5 isoform X6 [Aplysia californica]|uniref:Synaptotagmin-like protein 5 isoform X6 n=1 Tax=Aplysia californica TaxID=6500 RepID=A0ABM1W1R8_APLCA|nr:synaptotagmin-like protein 5 isoform X6 [Aplysia californica]
MPVDRRKNKAVEKTEWIPPIHNYTIDLTLLTESEEAMLNDVIERDLAISKSVDSRVSKLKKEIQAIRVAGALSPGDDQNAICARCKYKFWSYVCPWADHGKRCYSCKFKVCKKCRFLQSNGLFLCSLCLKQRQEKWLTGEWFNPGIVGGLVGSDLLQASIRDKGGKKRRRLPAVHPDNAGEKSVDRESTTKMAKQKAMDEKTKLVSAQRRSSYSHALENQKVSVILPPGNDNWTDLHAPVAESQSSLNVDSDEEKIDSSEPEVDSLTSSFRSGSSVATANLDTSSADTKSMSGISVHSEERNSGQQPSYSDEGNRVNSINQVEHPNSLSSIHRQQMLDSSHHGNGVVCDPAEPKSSADSFEEVYNSNVSRLMEMMTGAPLEASSLEADTTGPGSKHKRELPRTPKNGKSKELLLQKSLSLSEEVAASEELLKSERDSEKGFNDDDRLSFNALAESSSKYEAQSAGKEKYEKRSLPVVTSSTSQLNHKQPVPVKSSLPVQPRSEHGEGDQCDLDIQEIKDQVLPVSPQHQQVKGQMEEMIERTDHGEAGSSKVKPAPKYTLPQQVKEQKEELSRTSEHAVPDSLKVSLCRSGSSVSDSLSIITEVSEPCGEAECLPDQQDSDSDDTLYEGSLDSLSDEDEYYCKDFKAPSDGDILADMTSQSLGHGSDSEKELESSVASRETTESGRDINSVEELFRLTEDEQHNRNSDILSSHKSDKTDIKSKLSTKSVTFAVDECDESLSDSSRVDVEEMLEDDEEGGEGGAEINCPSVGIDLGIPQHGQEKPTLLSLAGGESYSQPQSLPVASVDLDGSAPFQRGHIGVGGDGVTTNTNSALTGGQQPQNQISLSDLGPSSEESTRDSDSGVTSSHTSRTNTPEQRQSLAPQHAKSQPSRLPLPSISVTNSGEERDGEEDDDIDELFSQHHPNMLGSRSSLADSRESIYSVYSNAGEVNYGRIPVTGDIKLHLSYDYKAKVMGVHIKACRDLAPVDTKHNRSDPYVKTYLLPDKTRGSKRKTKIKKHTLNPTFDEVLKYPISKTELESRSLWITVWHNDRFGRNDFLGEVTIPMDYYRFEENSPTWYTLQERVAPEDTSLMTYKGDLFISLKYVTADMMEASNKKKSGSSRKSKAKDKDSKSQAGLGEVHALIREAQNLTAMRAAAGSNSFCKGYLLPDERHSSKQKTPVIKKTTNPKWSHTLVFEGVDQDQLHLHGLELTIWDQEKLSSNDFLGGVRLNLGEGSYQGKVVDWMDAHSEEAEVWRSMINHPNEWIDAQLPLRASMGKQNVKK